MFILLVPNAYVAISAFAAIFKIPFDDMVELCRTHSQHGPLDDWKPKVLSEDDFARLFTWLNVERDFEYSSECRYGNICIGHQEYKHAQDRKSVV